jgi:hypothetical protein
LKLWQVEYPGYLCGKRKVPNIACVVVVDSAANSSTQHRYLLVFTGKATTARKDFS